MKPRLLALLALVLAALPLCAAPAGSSAAKRFADSLVRIEISQTRYDYRVPWVTRSAQTRKNGVVIEGNRILTTADGLSGMTLCRVRKDGMPRPYTARLEWADYHANVAVLSVDEPEFWTGLKAVKFAKEVPAYGRLEVVRWNNGRIEARTGEIERLFVGRGKLSYVRHLQLALSSEIGGSGWAEVVVRGKRLVGLTTSSANDRLTVLPVSVIRLAIEAREQDPPRGLGYFDFSVMTAKNPALLRSKGLESTERGVVVTRVGEKGIASDVLREGDVVLAIDGFDIDPEGNYLDPDYGRLSSGALATRGRLAGDVIPFTVWRDGAEVVLDYALPAADFSGDPVPEKIYDAAPEYLIAGGLLFQPLTGPFIDAFGKSTPVLLKHYAEEAVDADREGHVVLSAVLPDASNQGYEDARLLIIDSINGRPVANLDDVAAALAEPGDGYHTLLFMHDQPLRHMVLDAAETDAATAGILERYSIPAARGG